MNFSILYCYVYTVQLEIHEKKARGCSKVMVDRIKLNMCKFWLSEFDLFENMFSYTLVINQFKLQL